MMSQKRSQSHPRKSDRDGYISFGHPSVSLRLASGVTVEVDKGIADLIVVMNGIQGLATHGSCQGESLNYGYVQFMPDDTPGKAHTSIYFMYHMLRNMHTAWVRHRQSMAEHEASSGSEHPDSYHFKFVTELGNGYVLKWSPSIYPAVLDAARQAAEELRHET